MIQLVEIYGSENDQLQSCDVMATWLIPGHGVNYTCDAITQPILSYISADEVAIASLLCHGRNLITNHTASEILSAVYYLNGTSHLVELRPLGTLDGIGIDDFDNGKFWTTQDDGGLH
jgi:hypothetical protein